MKRTDYLIKHIGSIGRYIVRDFRSLSGHSIIKGLYVIQNKGNVHCPTAKLPYSMACSVL